MTKSRFFFYCSYYFSPPLKSVFFRDEYSSRVRRFFSGLSFCLFGISLGISSVSALAVSSDYVSLLEPITQQQPEALATEGWQALSSANRSLSDSWLADQVAIRVSHENDALTDDVGTQNWALGAEFSLWLPKQKEALSALSNEYQTKLNAQITYRKWLASGKLRQLVWAYRQAQIEEVLAASALEKAQELQENVAQKVQVGDTPQLDLLLAQKFVLEQESFLAQKRGQKNIIKEQFQFWTQTDVLPEGILETLNPPLSLDMHPKLRWVDASYGIAKAQYAQQKTLNQTAPSFFVGAQNDRDNTSDNVYLVFEVSVPIGKAPMNQLDVAERQQTIQQQESEQLRVKQALIQSIEAAKQTVRLSEQNRLLAQKQNEIAQETLHLAEQAYQLGESSIQSLLLIQKQTLEARSALELANAQLGEAIANANQAMGYLLEAYVD